MASALTSLPPELIEHIFDDLDARNDYLALALTCKTCAAHIVPEHLALRELILSTTHKETWSTLAQRPELAACVRSLTLVRAPLAMPCTRAYTEMLPAPGEGSYEEDTLFIAECVARLPRLTSLSLQSGQMGFFSMKDEDLDLILDSAASKLESLSLDMRWTPQPGARMYDVRNLRVLELGSGLISVDRWPDLCNMLALSPRLEVLELPSFHRVTEFDVDDPRQPLPLLPSLVRFSCAYDLDTPNCGSRLFDFLDASPSIVELSFWMPNDSLLTDGRPMPKLPNLRRILNARSTNFAVAFLRGKPPRSVPIETLECLWMNSWHTLDDYAALDPARLRVLHVFSVLSTEDTKSKTDRIAQMFPAVEELQLPARIAYRHQRDGTESQTGGIVVEFPILKDIAALFPRLRRVSLVGVDGSEVMRDTVLSLMEEMPSYDKFISARTRPDIVHTMDMIRERYPKLERVNGWLVKDGDTERASATLVRQVTKLKTRTRPPLVKLVLTRDGCEARFFTECNVIAPP